MLEIEHTRQRDQALLQGFDLGNLDEAFYHDPFPTYAALRSLDPIHRLADGGLLLTRFDDLRRVYKDPVTFSSDKRKAFAPMFGQSLIFEHHTTSLVFNDPPLHTRVRRLIQGALTAKAIAQREAGLIALVDRLLDGLAEQSAAAPTVDAIGDFAAAIPVQIICELMHIPQSHREPLQDWSLAILSALEPRPGDAMKQAAETAVAAFLDYLKMLIEQRRKSPLDPEFDVLTRLIQGTGVRDGLTEIELLHNCIFILNAGHETTTNLVGNGIALLLTHAQARQQLLAQPQLIDSTVEEVLRMESPNQLGNRLCTRDTVLSGYEIEAGTQITLCIGAANRDPAQFEAPDQFDITRSPNHHLAFASGPHVCAGVNLARLEARVALGRFIARFPKAALAGPAIRGRRARFRGFTQLPISLS